MEFETKQEKSKLEKMLDDPHYSLEDCMDEYLNEYEDTDVMSYAVMEETADGLEEDEDYEQSERLLELLDKNPNVSYFDYYEEEPITTKEWIKKRLGLEERKIICSYQSGKENPVKTPFAEGQSRNGSMKGAK